MLYNLHVPYSILSPEHLISFKKIICFYFKQLWPSLNTWAGPTLNAWPSLNAWARPTLNAWPSLNAWPTLNTWAGPTLNTWPTLNAWPTLNTHQTERTHSSSSH